MNVSFTSTIYVLKHLLNTAYIEVKPASIKKIGGLNTRVLCKINDNEFFQAGMVALGEGKAYITINQKRLKAFQINIGDKVNVVLKPDSSAFGMEMPVELETLLAQDEEGLHRFNLLTPGKQRYIINYVSTVKSEQLRIERAILLITNLKKLPVGKESFREMLGLEKR